MADAYDPYSQYGPTAAPQGGFSMVPLVNRPPGEPVTQTQVQQMADPNQLMQQLNQKALQIQQQAQPIMPQYIPRQFQQGPQPPWANPNTRAGQRANLGQSIGQAIGGAINQYQQRKELQKAQNIAMDMQRLSMAIQNPTDENKAMAEEILNDDKRRNEIAKTMNIQFMGDDQRKPYQKVANQLFHRKQAQTQQQQVMQQRQQATQQGQTPYFNQLQRTMPKMLGLSPEAMIEAQAMQLGFLPNAKEQLDVAAKMFQSQAYMDRTFSESNWRDAQTKALLFARVAQINAKYMTDEERNQLLQSQNDLRAAKNANDAKYQAQRIGTLWGAISSRERIAEGQQATQVKVAGIKQQTAEDIQRQKDSAKFIDQQLKNYQSQITQKQKELSDSEKSINQLRTTSSSAYDKLHGTGAWQAEYDQARTNSARAQAEINELTNSQQQMINIKKQTAPTPGPLYGTGTSGIYTTQPPAGQRAVTPSGAIQPPTAPQAPTPFPVPLPPDELDNEGIYDEDNP